MFYWLCLKRNVDHIYPRNRERLAVVVPLLGVGSGRWPGGNSYAVHEPPCNGAGEGSSVDSFCGSAEAGGSHTGPVSDVASPSVASPSLIGVESSCSASHGHAGRSGSSGGSERGSPRMLRGLVVIVPSREEVSRQQERTMDASVTAWSVATLRRRGMATGNGRGPPTLGKSQVSLLGRLRAGCCCRSHRRSTAEKLPLSESNDRLGVGGSLLVLKVEGVPSRGQHGAEETGHSGDGSDMRQAGFHYVFPTKTTEEVLSVHSLVAEWHSSMYNMHADIRRRERCAACACLCTSGPFVLWRPVRVLTASSHRVCICVPLCACTSVDSVAHLRFLFSNYKVRPARIFIIILLVEVDGPDVAAGSPARMVFLLACVQCYPY